MNEPGARQADFDREKTASQAHDFLLSCARAMDLCAETEIQSSMVRQFKKQLEGITVLDFKPNPIAVLKSCNLVKDMKLAKSFQDFALFLPWRYSPRSDDKGTEMGIMDFRDMFDLGNVTAGLMYVDSYKAYPEHSHPPAEMYFLISGTAEWRFGGNTEYQSLTAGNVIFNHSNDRHGVRAGHTPVLALYLLVT